MRTVGETQLPMAVVSTPDPGLAWTLAEMTGVKAVPVTRDYARRGCSDHCKEPHLHVDSQTWRWTATGARATVFLWSVSPLLRVRKAEASLALACGMNAPRKTATVRKIIELGWELPVGWDL